MQIKTTEIIKLPPLTLTFEPLLGEPPQQSPTVFAEGGTFVVVHFKPVGHVDLEALLVDLQRIFTLVSECSKEAQKHFLCQNNERRRRMKSCPRQKWNISTKIKANMAGVSLQISCIYHCFFAVYSWTGAFGDNFIDAFFVDGCIAI